MRVTASLMAAVLLGFSTVFAFAAPPEGRWPTYAQGQGLGRPDWVLVVPARRHDDGSVTLWDRSDPWTREWAVPAIIDGLRIVTLIGDDQDARTLTGRSIDEMITDEMQPLMAKYAAPALALVVRSSEGVAVAAWRPGYRASWDRSIGEGSDHASATETILRLFGSGGTPMADAPQPFDSETVARTTTTAPRVVLAGERFEGDRWDYLLDLVHVDRLDRGRVLSALETISIEPAEVVQGGRVIITLGANDDPFASIERLGLRIE